ncbi:MAG: hypothetical protein ACE5FH_03160 [Candidatus Zixiibacteriota bacterium]
MMISRSRLMARIALFSGLIYVLSWATAWLPNVNSIFFVTFLAGLLWGLTSGVAVGALGMGLWTTFNPYGPAPIPMMIVQVIGAAGSGAVGAIFRSAGWYALSYRLRPVMLVVAALLCTVLYYLPVNGVDAWLFQPFWPRFVAGLPFVGLSLISNIIIFPVFFGAALPLMRREGLAV